VTVPSGRCVTPRPSVDRHAGVAGSSCVSRSPPARAAIVRQEVLLARMGSGRSCPQIEGFLSRCIRFRVTFVGMGKRWGRRSVAAAVVGLVGVAGISACGGGGDESSDSSESTEGDRGSESGTATEPTSAESPSGSAETPSGEESSSGGEVSTADVEFTEWELDERRRRRNDRPRWTTRARQVQSRLRSTSLNCSHLPKRPE
jgi:hypothetical protein